MQTTGVRMRLNRRCAALAAFLRRWSCTAAGAAAICVLLSVAGCVNGVSLNGDEMRAYLEQKYGETFVIESEKPGSSSNPAMLGGDWALAYPLAAPGQLFTVREDPNQPGTFFDERVLAGLSAELAADYRARLVGAFGEDAIIGVTLSSPYSGLLESTDLGIGAESVISGRLDAATSVVLVAVPVDGPIDRGEYASAVYTAWAVAKDTGATRPTLAVWFFSGPRDAAESEMRMLGVPNTVVGYDSISGTAAYVIIDKEAWVESPNDVLQYFDTGR